MDYKKAYFILFNAITDCLEHLDNTHNILIFSQRETEKLYIEFENQTPLILNPKDKKD